LDHTDLLWPLAAAFLFLPQLLVARHVNDRTPDQMFTGDALPGDALAAVLLILASLLGQLVMARLIARDGTDGEALGTWLRQAVALMPAAVAVTLIQGIGTGFGLFLFVIPGLWIYCRLMLVLPLVATGHRDPIEAITASWQLTKGRALRLFGMVAVLLLGFLLLAIGINGIGAAVGVISTLAAGGVEEGWGIGRWLFEILGSAASSAMGVFFIAFLTILMQALKSQPTAVSD
jgi:Membrane domain of glycerophosphoryl diester phosphodiesterase